MATFASTCPTVTRWTPWSRQGADFLSLILPSWHPAWCRVSKHSTDVYGINRSLGEILAYVLTLFFWNVSLVAFLFGTQTNGDWGEGEFGPFMITYTALFEATSQGKWAAIGSWKRKGTDSFLESPEGVQPCPHLDFGSVILISDFWPPELWKTKPLLL